MKGEIADVLKTAQLYTFRLLVLINEKTASESSDGNKGSPGRRGV